MAPRFPAFLVLAAIAISACTTIPLDQRQEIRDEVNQVAEETIANLVAENPGLRQKLDSAVGYAVGRVSATKLPIVGGGYGLAVLHDLERGTRTYLNITRFDLGAGLGVGRYRALVVFDTRDAMERFRTGTWERSLGMEAAAGTASSTGQLQGQRAYCPAKVAKRAGAWVDAWTTGCWYPARRAII